MATDDEVPARKLQGIEDVLNQTYFSSKHDQMIEYGKRVYTKIVLTPKIMNFSFFAQFQLYFHHHLHFQVFGIIYDVESSTLQGFD